MTNDKKMKKFLVTTPIYYPNGYPHIGHAYSSFIADFLARYKRMMGYQVKFSTGNDENSQKILEKAKEDGKDVMQYLDEMESKWKDVRIALDISFTDFIRTTQVDHKELVQKVLAKAHEKGDIYQGIYKGFYCIGCEAFKKESDLIKNDKGELVCPDHLTPPQILEEKNYFFKLSKYQDQLQEFYQKNPEFLVPQYRFNEVISFTNSGLEDFSVSRETNKFGIPLPFDPEQVTYVWYDALFNYVTVCIKDDFWVEGTEIVHVLGKDISRFHAIFWPAMLISADMRMPDKEYITGFFTVDGQKMGKSLGNVIDPVEMIKKYDRDAVIFNLLYDVPIGADGDFSESRLASLYESMLIGGRGNLVNRVTSLCQKYNIVDGTFIINKWERFKGDDENGLIEMFENGWNPDYIQTKYLDKAEIRSYLEDRYKLVQKANEYITKAEPWKKYKNEATKVGAISDLQFLLYIVKNLALISAPFLINGFAKIQKIFGNEDLSAIDSGHNLMNENFAKSFDAKDFKVSLNAEIIYGSRRLNDHKLNHIL